ncbi:hypothetical protein D0C36_21240 [Mucilaginibacter conchicola]|uniref:Uncharacterized protein n=1 Tax=Mucilaginibacter conchicola TaxID=2303333 RepID=A0A372NN00_9SPHI|nr:hypothetical protein [Mucilaginibacter conchicola]RFZ90324.1 hypothetical protein D0C36_21240 [Mucilaginibacter conchicola]
MLQKQLTHFVVIVRITTKGVYEMMFTRTFELFLIAASVVTVLAIAGFAVFCRYRAKSFAHTGRLTDVQIWATRADISWVIAVLFAVIASFAGYNS